MAPSLPKRKAKDEPSERRSRFIETARALGCNEDEAAFEAKLGKLARAHPKVAPKAKPKAPRKKKPPAK